MIHRIRVQNFKSLADVSVELSPVTVLVGKSGTGKSNFIHAIRFLRDVLAADRRNPGGLLQLRWAESRPAAGSGQRTRFEVEFSIAGIDNRFKYILSMNGFNGAFEERLDLGDRCLFHQSSIGANRWIVAPEFSHNPNPGEIAISQIPSVPEIATAFIALTTGIGCYAFSDKVLGGTKINPSGSPNNPVPPQSSTLGLDDDGSNYLDALKHIVSNLQDLSTRRGILAVLQRLNSTVSTVDLNDLQRPAHIVVGHKINGKTLSLHLSQESDGFRRFYAHLLALYQKPPKQTLIFEHPEDGIHPGALSLLADEFKAVPQNGRGQVLLATHNPMFLDQFSADQVRVVELEGFETRIGFISEEQKEAIRDNLLSCGELLTVDPARMQQESGV